jgi:hypothetical protein
MDVKKTARLVCVCVCVCVCLCVVPEVEPGSHGMPGKNSSTELHLLAFNETRSHHVIQAGLKLADPPASAS